MPALHTVQLAKILYKLTADVEQDKLDDVLTVFIGFLEKNHILSKAPHIIEAFEKYAKEVDGREDIHVVSAKKLSNDVISDITEKLGAHPDAQIETSVDTELIGGVVARKGNTIFDASIKTELERLARSLN